MRTGQQEKLEELFPRMRFYYYPEVYDGIGIIIDPSLPQILDEIFRTRNAKIFQMFLETLPEDTNGYTEIIDMLADRAIRIGPQEWLDIIEGYYPEDITLEDFYATAIGEANIPVYGYLYPRFHLTTGPHFEMLMALISGNDYVIRTFSQIHRDLFRDPEQIYQIGLSLIGNGNWNYPKRLEGLRRLFELGRPTIEQFDSWIRYAEHIKRTLIVEYLMRIRSRLYRKS